MWGRGTIQIEVYISLDLNEETELVGKLNQRR